mgnify:CR=1 FL=1
MKRKDYYLDAVIPSGHGHFKVKITFRGKQYSAVTANMHAVDAYQSEEGEKDGRKLRRKEGYTALRNEVIRKNNLR